MNVLFLFVILFELKICLGHYAEEPETFLIAKNSLRAGSNLTEGVVEFDDWEEVQSAIDEGVSLRIKKFKLCMGVEEDIGKMEVTYEKNGNEEFVISHGVDDYSCEELTLQNGEFLTSISGFDYNGKISSIQFITTQDQELYLGFSQGISFFDLIYGNRAAIAFKGQEVDNGISSLQVYSVPLQPFCKFPNNITNIYYIS